ncbi:MAG: chloride channel protein [Sodalinema sp.]|uniref:chloride channel protein n=1 Tax=Sodalinema sp. TaxID=3080550 RepID=UPI0011F85CE0|nr:MAG: CBS domain-containing protein [Phormidium sp. SL48-SHIP]
MKPLSSSREVISSLSRRLHLYFLEPRRLALLEACFIGLVSGLAAVILRQGISWLGGWRVQASPGLPIWLKLPLFGLVGGFLAGWLIQRFSPDATGSGVSHVKVQLASSQRLPQAMSLNLRLAVVKLLSTVLVVGSGMSLGRQGPTVHMGAALAAAMTRWMPTSPGYRRQTIAAGAAAGLAAGFNAPIAGVLFVVEELLQDVSSLTLGTAILASFVGAVVSGILGGGPWDVTVEPDVSTVTAQFSPQDIPALLLLGVITGICSGWFNRGIVASLTWQRRYLAIGLPGRIAVAGLLSGTTMALLPVEFQDNAGLREFLTTGEASLSMIAIALVVKFALTLLVYGSGASGGLFAPTLILGSAIGSLVGLSSQLLFDIGDTRTFALAGMGAFFGAVAKIPITAIVIIFEITADFNVVLPLMIVSVLAYVVAEQVSAGSLYDRLLELRGWEQPAPQEDSSDLVDILVNDVMQRRVETVESHLPLAEVLEIFRRSPYGGFPVVEDTRLVGMITETDLMKLSQLPISDETPISELMMPQPVMVSSEDSLMQALYLLERHQIGRLPVVDGRRLVGIITHSDIVEAEARELIGRGRYRKVEPSYPVYVTRAPATGRGRLLVPLANPKTAPLLLQFAAAIAAANHYELECLQVVPVPRHRSPSETPVRITHSRRLLQTALHLSRRWQIPVHTQIRVAHDVAAAVLETIQERHIDTLLMGWKGGTRTPGRVFGDVADTLLRQAPCQMVLVKWGQAVIEQNPATMPELKRWLVPLGGGANALAGLELLSALVTGGDCSIVRLCQVFQEPANAEETEFLKQTAQLLESRLPCSVSAIPIYGSSVVEALLEEAQSQEYDAILLGASRQGVLQQALHGNIPRAIARGSHCTTIVVRHRTLADAEMMR